MRLGVGGIFEVFLNGKSVSRFHNHVTDYGLNTMVTKSIDTLMTKCHVGSGNDAPADSDTALASEIANTSTTTTNTMVSSSAAGYVGRRRKYSFSVGAAEGTLAEMGLSDGTSLFNRQLFLDHYGNATTIEVGATDTLEILCEIRVYIVGTVNTKVSRPNFTIGTESYPSNFSFSSGFFNTSGVSGSSTYLLQQFPYSALNILNSASCWRIAHTTVDISSGDSGFGASATSPGGTVASSVSMTSYVAGSFELSFEIEWTAGALSANNYNLLFLGNVYASFYSKMLEIGISSPYNQASETVWQDSHAYTAGDRFISALGDSFIYEVTTGGTSHASAPTWPTTVGGTVTDGGGVEYECVAPLLRVESTETLTLNVTLSWGRET